MEESKNTKTPESVTASEPSELEAAIRTVTHHVLKSGVGATPADQAAFAAAWPTTQLCLLLSYMERHARTLETAMATVQEPTLKKAFSVVLKDAADRCAFVSRDLDLARGEPMGTPTPEWSDRSGKPAMASRVRESRTGSVVGARQSL